MESFSAVKIHKIHFSIYIFKQEKSAVKFKKFIHNYFSGNFIAIKNYCGFEDVGEIPCKDELKLTQGSKSNN